MRLFGPYYYGKHKWDNYLLEIQETIQSEQATRQAVAKNQEKALRALNSAHQKQLSALREQTEQLHRIEDAIQGGFEEMRAEFEWGFALIVDRMEAQIDHLSQIAARLDAIHKTLQSPLLTQARELFQLGQEHFRKGLLDKAIEAYLKAEEKNEVDFPLQLQIGKLYLYGRDEDDDVIDLTKAEKHLLLAARYADAEKGTFQQWNVYCGQAYFHAAVAAYLIGEQEQGEGRTESMRACLARALTYLNKAAILWPRFTEIVYTQAKCHALLGQTNDATKRLEALSDRDRRYFAKAARDGDFETFQPDIEELFRTATILPGPLARATGAKLDEVIEALAWAKRSAPTSADDLRAVATIENELARAKQSLPTLEVDIESLSDDLDQNRQSLEAITQKAFKTNIESAQAAVSECKSRRGSREYANERLKEKMKETSGTGAFWTCALVTIFFIGPSTRGIFAAILIPLIGDGPLAAFIFLASDVAGGLVVGAIGSQLWRDHKNQPHRKEIQENLRMIEEHDRMVPALSERLYEWQRIQQSFEAWRAKHPLAPHSLLDVTDARTAAANS